MKLIWHIIKKDIARERWALALWVLLFLAQVGLGIFLLHSDRMAANLLIGTQKSNGGLVVLQFAMTYILVARLVQADALVGTNMFWLTRPISGARLLVAKISGALLLFGLLPVLLLLPWWLWCDFGMRDILWAALETLGWQLFMIAPAFVVASLTDDFSRVLLWTLLLAIAFFTWVVDVQSTTIPARIGRETQGVLFTRHWLIVMVSLVGAAGVVVHHFLTRRLMRSVVLAILSLGLAALVGRVWRWDLSKYFVEIIRSSRVVVPPNLEEGVKFKVTSARVMGEKSAREQDRSLRVTIKIEGLPTDLSLTGKNAMQTWRWTDGVTITRESSFEVERRGSLVPAVAILYKAYALSPPLDDPETVQWWRGKRGKFNAAQIARGRKPSPLSIPSHKEEHFLSVFAPLPESIFAKIRMMPPAYETAIQGVITRPRVLFELPLKAGAYGSADSKTLRIMRLVQDDRERFTQLATLVSTESSFQANGLWQAGPIGVVKRDSFNRNVWTINRTTGDVGGSWFATRSSRQMPIAGVSIGWRTIAIAPRIWIRQGKSVPNDPQWLEHNTLVLMTDDKVAQFVREIKTERLEIESETTLSKEDVPEQVQPLK